MSDDFDEFAEDDLDDFTGRAVRGEPAEEEDDFIIEEDNEEVIPEKKNLAKDKWFGIPPPGQKKLSQNLFPLFTFLTKIPTDFLPAPYGPRFYHTIHISKLIIIEIFIWAGYRILTAPIYGQFGTTIFFIGHIIAAPTIHLGPILIYWYLFKGERQFPFKLTRKNVFTGVIVGLFAGLGWRIIQYLVWDTIGIAMGAYDFGSLTWYSFVTTAPDGWFNFMLMTFVMYVIVGPVEEFEFRGRR